MTTKTMMTVMVALGVLVSSNATFAQATIPAGAKLFIENMEGGLSGYLRAELMKKKVPVTLVSSADAAQFIMIWEAQDRKSGWSEGWLTTKKDNSTGSVTIITTATKDIVWAEEAGDRSLMMGGLSRGGPRKVASRIADKLKDFIKK